MTPIRLAELVNGAICGGFYTEGRSERRPYGRKAVNVAV